MADDEHLKILTAGAAEWNNWRDTHPEISPDLSGVSFPCESELTNGTKILWNADNVVANYNFCNVNFQKSRFSGMSFRNVIFHSADLSFAEIKDTKFASCYFSAYSDELRSAKGQGDDVPHLLESRIRESACCLHNTVAYGAEFKTCSLNFCDLTSLRMDETTSFLSVGVFGAKISRGQLDSLENNGGLTTRRLGEMLISDDIATMRNSFSGFWNAVHLTALFIFLLPYGWFLSRQWELARVGEPMQSIGGTTSPIVENLFRFIVSGGETWRVYQPDLIPITLFVLAVLINFFRLALFLKTKRIEHSKLISGFYVKFRLEGAWKIALRIYQYLSLIGIAVVAANSIMFLLKPVPI